MAEVGTLWIRLRADLKDFDKGMKKTQAKLNRLGGQMAFAGKSMTKWITLPMLAAGAGMLALAKKTADAGDQIHKMSQRTGFSAETLSELKHAADLSGTSLEGLETGVRRMQKVLFEASQGATSAKETLGLLGLQVRDLQGLKPEDQFMRVAESLAAVRDPARRAALAQEAFGKAGTQLLPMLADGIEGLRGMRQEARDLGLVFDQQGVEASARFNDQLTRLKGSFTGLYRSIGMQVMPIIADRLIPAIQNKLIPALRRLSVRIQNLIAWWERLAPPVRTTITYLLAFVAVTGPAIWALGALAKGVAGLIAVVRLLAVPFAALKLLVSNVVFAFAAWRGGAATLFQALGFLISRALMIKFALVGLLLGAVWLAFNWNKASNWMATSWHGLVADVLNGVAWMLNGLSKLNSAFGIKSPLLDEWADSLSAAAGRATESMRASMAAAKQADELAKAGKLAAGGQWDLADGLTAAGEAAQANLQSFDEVHSLQDEMTTPDFTMPSFQDFAMPNVVESMGLGGVTESLTQAGAAATSLWDRFWDGWDRFDDNVEATVKGWWENVKTDTTTLWTEITTGLGEQWNNIKLMADEKWTGITNTVSEWTDSTRLRLETRWNDTSTWLSTKWDGIKVGAAEKWSGITDTISEWTDSTKTRLHTRWNEITTWLGLKWDWIKNTSAAEKWQGITDTVSEWTDSTRTRLETRWNNIATWLGTKWDGIKTWAAEKWQGITDTVSEWTDTAKTRLHTKWDEIKTSLSTTWEGIKTTAGNIWRDIANTIIGVINRIIGSINGLIGGMNRISFNAPDWVPGIGGKTWGVNIPTIPDVPLMDTGGLLEGPGIFEVGPGVTEIARKVGPSDDIASAIGPAVFAAMRDAMQMNKSEGGSGQEREMILEIDGSRIGRVLMPILENEGQRRGGVRIVTA